jgi:hypothetical protein
VGRGGAGSHFISPVCGGGRERKEGAGNKRSSQDYQDCMEEPDHSHLVKQGFQFFVSGEDDIKPGSIPSNTVPRADQCMMSQVLQGHGVGCPVISSVLKKPIAHALHLQLAQ